MMQEQFILHPDKIICFYCSTDIGNLCNSAFLLCAYMMIVCGLTPEQAYAPFIDLTPMFAPYRDAGYGPATYHITVFECLRSLNISIKLGFINIQNFDLEEYEFYEKIENGDLNWITKKFVAMAVPKENLNSQSLDSANQSMVKTAMNAPIYSVSDIKYLAQWMLDNNIHTVIRLNNITYNKKNFTDQGIEHYDLYFPDGTTPSESILLKFLEICETRPGPIAVHCKAGLGRTGLLISCFLMKHYGLKASEVIAFLRIIRPGSVVGPQQNFLEKIQNNLWKQRPSTPLPKSISCYYEPFNVEITRFGEKPSGIMTGLDVNIKDYINENSVVENLVSQSVPIQPRKAKMGFLKTLNLNLFKEIISKPFEGENNK